MLVMLWRVLEVHWLTCGGGGGCSCCADSDLSGTRWFAGFGFLFPGGLFVQLNSLDDDAVLADLVLRQHVVESGKEQVLVFYNLRSAL